MSPLVADEYAGEKDGFSWEPVNFLVNEARVVAHALHCEVRELPRRYTATLVQKLKYKIQQFARF